MQRSVCIDIDNVITATDPVIREIIARQSQGRIDLRQADIKHFDYRRNPTSDGQLLDDDGWCAAHHEFATSGVARVRPLEASIEAIGSIRQHFDVHLATSRLPVARGGTLEWLAAHSLDGLPLHWVEPGKKHLIDVRFAACIEDDGDQAIAFAQAGVRAFVLAYPWNSHARHERITRCSDWSEVLRRIELFTLDRMLPTTHQQRSN